MRTARALKLVLAIGLTAHLARIAYDVSLSAWMADESAYQFFGMLLDRDPGLYGERIAAIGFYRGAAWLLKDALGVFDLGLLRTAFGVSLHAAWPLSIGICWLLARRTDPGLALFPVLGFALGSANAGLFTASESHFMHAVFWVIVMGTLTAGDRPGRKVLVVVCYVLFALSYAGAGPLALLLLAMGLWRFHRSGWRCRFDLLTALLASLTCAVAMWGYFARSEMAEGMGEGFARALGGDPVHVNLILSTAAMLLLFSLIARPGSSGRRGLAVALALIGIAAGIYHWALPGRIQPNVQGYYVRGVNVLVPAALILLLALYRARARINEGLRALAPAILLLWLGQLAFLAAAARQFGDYVEFLAEYTRGRNGVILVATPGHMEPVVYDETSGHPLQRRLVDGTPVHPFTGMWVALPAHCLLYSEGDVRVVLMPTSIVLPEYGAIFTEEGRAKLARFGLRVSVADRVIESPDRLHPLPATGSGFQVR